MFCGEVMRSNSLVRSSILDGDLINNIIVGSVFFTLTLAIVSLMEEACGIVARKIPESTSHKGIALVITLNNVITIYISKFIDVG